MPLSGRDAPCCVERFCMPIMTLAIPGPRVFWSIFSILYLQHGRQLGDANGGEPRAALRQKSALPHLPAGPGQLRRQLLRRWHALQ